MSILTSELPLPNEPLLELCKDLDLGDVVLMKVRDVFQRDILQALEETLMVKSTIACDYTFIRDLPTGDETGKFLGLNLTNTTFRIVVVHLTKKQFDIRSKNFIIPQHLRTGEASTLMDYIVSHLYAFILKYRILDEYLPLTFTFSIPYEQRSLTDGHLMEWQGELQCEGMRTRDVADLLQEAITRIDLNVTVVATITDVTGMLISCAWERGNARAAFKVGKSLTCAYVERIDDIIKFKEGRYKEASIGVTKPYMIMNIDCGRFGKIGKLSKIEFIRTQWDKEIDKESEIPGDMAFEKMVCVDYVAELVRKVLHTAITKEIIFAGESRETLEHRLKFPKVFKFEYLVDIESDPPGKYTMTWQVLAKLGNKAPTRQDCIDLRFVCYAVLQRACHLIAANAAAVLNHMGFSDVTVAFGGRMYRDVPGFATHLSKKLRDLTSPYIYFRCFTPQDGVGMGAALLAAVLTTPIEEKLDDGKPHEEVVPLGIPMSQTCDGVC